MEVFIHRATGILRACVGGPPEGRSFLLVVALALLAFVVTLEHVGMIVGMKRFNTFHGWIVGIASLALLLGSSMLGRDTALQHGAAGAHAHAVSVGVAVIAGLVVAVPLLALIVRVSYFGGVCMLGLAVAAALIVGTVTTEALRNHRAAISSSRPVAVEPRGLDWLTPGSGDP